MIVLATPDQINRLKTDDNFQELEFTELPYVPLQIENLTPGVLEKLKRLLDFGVLEQSTKVYDSIQDAYDDAPNVAGSQG